MERTCKVCNVCKTTDYFYKKNKKGFSTKCKDCESKIKYTKYDCECGKQYTYAHKQRHLRSNYHKKRVNQ